MPCGGEGQEPCFGFTCDDGLGQDPPVTGNCRACYIDNAGWMCNHDFAGQIGEPAWEIGGIENLRVARLCDYGLTDSGGTCVNDTRFWRATRRRRESRVPKAPSLRAS